MSDSTDPARAARKQLEHLQRKGITRIKKGVPMPASALNPTAAPASTPTEPARAAAPPARPPAQPASPSDLPPLPVVNLNLFGRDIVTAGEIADRSDNTNRLAAIADEISGCRKCRLCNTRNKTVPGEGNPEPRLVFVGEGPGADEDSSGRPFVGRAGQLLTKMIEAMGIARGDVFICNVVKCRPPENRPPQPDEVAACEPYLLRQLELLKPEIVVALGATAASTLLQTHDSMGRMRNKWYNWRGLRLLVSYHPSYLLRSPGEKAKSWADLQQVMRFLRLPPFDV